MEGWDKYLGGSSTLWHLLCFISIVGMTSGSTSSSHRVMLVLTWSRVLPVHKQAKLGWVKKFCNTSNCQTFPLVDHTNYSRQIVTLPWWKPCHLACLWWVFIVTLIEEVEPLVSHLCHLFSNCWSHKCMWLSHEHFLWDVLASLGCIS